LYFLTSIIWVIKSKWMRWAGHVARMGGIAYIQGYIQGLVVNPKEIGHLETLGTDGSI